MVRVTFACTVACVCYPLIQLSVDITVVNSSVHTTVFYEFMSHRQVPAIWLPVPTHVHIFAYIISFYVCAICALATYGLTDRLRRLVAYMSLPA